jgi:hypothetical protein
MSKLSCDWCGIKCDKSCGAKREHNITYINNEEEEIQFATMEQTLWFCSANHRHEYLFGM